MAFSLIAKFGLDATGLKTELTKLRGQVTDLADKWAKIGLAAGAAAFTMLAKGAMDLAEQLRNTAMSLGINVEALQSLHYVAEQNGSSSEQMTKALEKLQIGLQRAKEGSSTHREALQKLGLSMEALSRMPLERQMESMAKAYHGSTDKAQAYNAVTELLGDKIGPKLMATLQQLAGDGFDQVAQSAVNAGHVMSTETVVALEKANQAIQNFKKQATIAVGEIIVNFRSEEGLKLLGMQIMKVLGQFGAGIVDAVIEGGRMFWAVFEGAVVGITNKLQDYMVDAVQAVAALINKVLPARFEINVGNLDEFRTSGKGIAESITEALARTEPSTFRQTVTETWDGLIAEQQQVVDALNEVDFGEDADALRNAGVQAGEAVAVGGDAAATQIEQAAETVADAAMDIITAGREVIQGIRTGENFAGASDAALRALIRQNTDEAQANRAKAMMDPFGGYYQKLAAAMKEIEASNAQKELDMRAKIARSFAMGGESAVYRAFPQMDPLKLDKLIDQFGRNLTESERTANTIEGIARGLARNKIIPPL